MASPPRTPTPLPSGRTGSRPLFRHPGRVAIVTGGLVLVAALVAGAIASSDTSDLQSDQRQPAEVTSVSPAPGAIVGPTTAVSVDLRDDLIGELTVCAPTPTECTPIPLDQTRFIAGLGQVTFKPTDTTDLTEFPAGPVSVRVDYHLQGSLAADAGSYTWSFVVKA